MWGKKWGDDAGVGSVGEGDEGYDPTWMNSVVVGLDRAGVDILEQLLGFDNDIDMLGGVITLWDTVVESCEYGMVIIYLLDLTMYNLI